MRNWANKSLNLPENFHKLFQIHGLVGCLVDSIVKREYFGLIRFGYSKFLCMIYNKFFLFISLQYSLLLKMENLYSLLLVGLNVTYPTTIAVSTHWSPCILGNSNHASFSIDTGHFLMGSLPTILMALELFTFQKVSTTKQVINYVDQIDINNTKSH